MSATDAGHVQLIYEVPIRHDAWVLDEEDIPESPLHDAILFLLVQILVAWRAREGRDALVARNIALRWNPARPREGVDPDVCIVEPALPDDATSICTWLPGHRAPRVAIEVVSPSTAEKDYASGPERYAASGTRELWVFDPRLSGPEVRGGPHRLQVWRRDDEGGFRRVHAGDAPARSEELGAWLVVTDDGTRLRIAEDATGTRLWPTAEEAAQAEIAALRAELRGRER